MAANQIDFRTANPGSVRMDWGKRVLLGLSVLLLVRVLWQILAAYADYLPPNFEEAPFLLGREEIFTTGYAVAFYVHLACGPFCLLSAVFLIASGSGSVSGRMLRKSGHRWVGRLHLLVLLFGLVPSGVILAWNAHAGPIAAGGFLVLSLLTAVCGYTAGSAALRRRWSVHRLWAWRCFFLLLSPLLLRLTAGAAIVLDLESPGFYQANAWLSWLVPLGAGELLLNWNAVDPKKRCAQKPETHVEGQLL